MGKQKISKYMAFKRFLVSYFFILIIPITMGSYVYFQALSVIENNAVNFEDFMIQQSRDIIDSYLSSIDLSVFTLSTNSTLQAVINMPQPTYGSDKVYQLIQVINNMKTNNISGSLDSTTYVFLRKTDVVINSNYANYNIQHFYENLMKYNGISYEDWYRQVFETNNYKTLLPSHKITMKRLGLSDVTYEAITYIQSIPQGAIIVHIDTNKIRDLLNDAVLAHNGSAFIIDENKQIIVKSNDNIVFEEMELETLALEKQTQHTKINGENSIVFSIKSNYNDWHYICVIPTRSLMNNVQHIKVTALINMSAVLIVGCLLSIFFSKNEVKPIGEILSSLGIASVDKKKKDEYSLIKDNINILINKNRNMNEALSELKDVLIGQLLNGTINEIEEARNILKNLGLSLEGNRYVVVVPTISRYAVVKGIDVNTLLEENAIKRITDSFLQKNMDGNGCTYIIEPQQIAVILCFNSNDDDLCRKQIRQYIETINNELIQACNISLYYGIGNLYGSLSDVSLSFFEAKVALHQFDFTEQSDYMSWYSDIPVSRQYYYPMDVERILANMVKSGNYDELIRTLQHIKKENFESRRLSYSMQFQLFSEMKATLLKICNEINLDSPAIGIDALKMWNISSEDCMCEIIDAFCQLCEVISKNKKSHNQRMLDDILEYLQKNYSDANISLQSLSSMFKISSSYLSQFFKEQTGQNFSEYLEEIRIKKACELLRNLSLTIEEISGYVGYNNSYSFRRAFKRRLGQLPNEYRECL